MYLYDVDWLDRWSLITGSKYLEYISRIRIWNNNWTLIGKLSNNNVELKVTKTIIWTEVFDWTKEENWIELECKIYNKIIYVNRPKKTLKGNFTTSQEGLPELKSTQIRWFLGQSDERLDLERAKVLKTTLSQGGPSDSSPLWLDGSHDGHAGGWTSWEVAKDAQERVGKQF